MSEAKCLRPLVLLSVFLSSSSHILHPLPEGVWVLQARKEGVAVGNIVQRDLTLSRCKIMSWEKLWEIIHIFERGMDNKKQEHGFNKLTPWLGFATNLMLAMRRNEHSFLLFIRWRGLLKNRVCKKSLQLYYLRSGNNINSFWALSQVHIQKFFLQPNLHVGSKANNSTGRGTSDRVFWVLVCCGSSVPVNF